MGRFKAADIPYSIFTQLGLLALFVVLGYVDRMRVGGAVERASTATTDNIADRAQPADASKTATADKSFNLSRLLPVMAILGALIIFPPFRLPNAGLDSKRETLWLCILGFGTCIFMGTLIGVGVGEWAIQTGNWVFDFPYLKNFPPIAFLIAAFCAVAMVIAFIKVGFLSREYRRNVAFQFAKGELIGVDVGKLIFTASVGFAATETGAIWSVPKK